MDSLIPAECKVIDPPLIDPTAELKALEDQAEAEHGAEIEDEGDEGEGDSDADDVD